MTPVPLVLIATLMASGQPEVNQPTTPPPASTPPAATPEPTPAAQPAGTQPQAAPPRTASTPTAPAVAPRPVPSMSPLVDLVSAERLKADVERLCAFGTRHTLSDAKDATRGIGAARQWILTEFENADGVLDESLETFEAPPSVRLPEGGTIVNVVGRVPGTMKEAANRLYYVVGHYDSRNAEAMDAKESAPGANDNASGTAVVMELARILAGKPLESTVVFLCTAGEEQGLIGAKFHVDKVAADSSVRVMGVLNNDIVGDPWGARPRMMEAPERWVVRVFSEGLPRNPSAEEYAKLRAWGAENDSASRQLARFIAEAGESDTLKVKPQVVMRLDRFMRGGDHSAFSDKGIPAVRFTVMHEDFSRQHANVVMRENKPYGDVPEFVDGGYLADVARLNLHVLIQLANAPSPPADVRMLTKELSNATMLKWTRSPEPDVAGYVVQWRSTTEWSWPHSLDVGSVEEATLDVSKDTFIFGVSAYDKDGNMSPVSFAGAATE